MGWNGNGTYTRTNGDNTGSTLWEDDKTDGDKIVASRHDTHDEDLATAINACLTKNNESKPTADFVPNADNSYDLGSSSVGWVSAYLTGGVVFDERADHGETPSAGIAELWVKSDTPAALVFTDDAGTDLNLSTQRPTVGTEQATTSGTAVDFTGLPDWVTQITISLDGVSTSGTPTQLIVQIGDSGGVENTGYVSYSAEITASATAMSNTTVGYLIHTPTASEAVTGSLIITRTDASNQWTVQGSFMNTVAGGIITSAGVKSLSGTLDRVRLTSVAPETFNAGAVNIRYS